MKRPLNKLQRLSNKIINVKSFGKRVLCKHSINIKNLKCSFLADLMYSGVSRITQKNVNICAMGNSKTHVSTSNLDFIAFAILKVDP